MESVSDLGPYATWIPLIISAAALGFSVAAYFQRTIQGRERRILAQASVLQKNYEENRQDKTGERIGQLWRLYRKVYEKPLCADTNFSFDELEFAGRPGSLRTGQAQILGFGILYHHILDKEQKTNAKVLKALSGEYGTERSIESIREELSHARRKPHKLYLHLMKMKTFLRITDEEFCRLNTRESLETMAILLQPIEAAKPDGAWKSTHWFFLEVTRLVNEYPKHNPNYSDSPPPLYEVV